MSCPGVQHLRRPPGRGNQARQLVFWAEFSVRSVISIGMERNEKTCRNERTCPASSHARYPKWLWNLETPPKHYGEPALQAWRAACLPFDLALALFPRI